MASGRIFINDLFLATSMYPTWPLRALSKAEVMELFQRYMGIFTISPHTLDHIDSAQRDVYTNEWLRRLVLERRPTTAWLQENGCYAFIYKQKLGRAVKVILAANEMELEVLTLYKPPHHATGVKNNGETHTGSKKKDDFQL